MLGLTFLGFALVMLASYIMNLNIHNDLSITTVVAALLTFLLGALASFGYVIEAGSAAVVAALLLGMKPILHEWLKKLEQQELYAALKLLLISVVLLSFLPNQGFGPWKVFNPFEIWSMVVLVATISFCGYFAIKIAGPEKGVIFTSLFAGFVSSTALTYHYANIIRKKKAHKNLLTMGILLACSTMFLRLLILIAIINPLLLKYVAIPALIMSLAIIIPTFIYKYKASAKALSQESMLLNPLDLKIAILFGALLALFTLATKAISVHYGSMGLFFISMIGGFVDVDALVLPLARMSLETTNYHVTSIAIIVAASANTLLKGGMALVIAGKEMFISTFMPLLLSTLLGLGAIYFL